MKRILFVLLLLLLVPSPVRANTALLKGTHITSGVNAALFNTLNNDVWMGDDSVVIAMRSVTTQAPYLAMQGEYIHRIPYLTYPQEVQAVLQFPHFNHKWEVLNECDLGGRTPQECATLIQQNMAFILVDDPNAYIIVQLPSQYHFSTFAASMLEALPPNVLSRINALSFHYYPSVHRDSDGVFAPLAAAAEVKKYIRGVVRPVMNKYGVVDGWLTEIGFDAAQVTKTEAALFVPALWADLETFAWLRGGLWYEYEYNGLNYVPLCNTLQTQCNKVGQAWRGLQ